MIELITVTALIVLLAGVLLVMAAGGVIAEHGEAAGVVDTGQDGERSRGDLPGGRLALTLDVEDRIELRDRDGRVIAVVKYVSPRTGSRAKMAIQALGEIEIVGPERLRAEANQQHTPKPSPNGSAAHVAPANVVDLEA